MDITAQVRLRIQDRWRYASEQFTGNGLASSFQLAQGAPYSTLTGASAFVRGATGYTPTAATFDLVAGVVSFGEVISANGVCRAAYQWAVFADDEVTQFISDGGNLAGASLEAVRALQFDAAKRARWAAPAGSQVDDTKACALLNQMYRIFSNELSETSEGGITSWATI